MLIEIEHKSLLSNEQMIQESLGDYKMHENYQWVYVGSRQFPSETRLYFIATS